MIIDKADVCVLISIPLIVFGCVYILLAPPTLESMVYRAMSSCETLILSSVGWVMGSQTKTQAAVRTGVVWTFMGWMIKPAIRFGVGYVKRRRVYDAE